MLNSRMGPLDTDWFASEHNAKLPRFYSKYWYENTSGVDAFSENWAGHNGLFVPPIKLISRVLLFMETCNATGVIVLPVWKSAPFWPLLCSNTGSFNSFILEWIELPVVKEFYVPSKSGKGIFGNRNLDFPMLACKVSFKK